MSSPVKERFAFPGRSLPLMFEPSGSQQVDIVEWVLSNRDYVEKRLLEHGSLLFHGFDISSVPAFERFASAFCPELYSEYGDLPPEKESTLVYGVTPYPPSQRLLFHNEAAHTPRWPLKQMFCCLQKAEKGGETTLVDCRAVAKKLGDKVLDKFRERRLTYVQNFVPDLEIIEGFKDVTWQEFFRTTERSRVEEICKQDGIDLLWRDNGIVGTRRTALAVARHPKTGEVLWFNQVQLQNARAMLDEATFQSLVKKVGMEYMPRMVYYGDGSPIEDDVLDAIGRTLEAEAVSFVLERGDVVVNDNMIVAHAREAYSGPRKVLVAMGELTNESEVSV